MNDNAPRRGSIERAITWRTATIAIALTLALSAVAYIANRQMSEEFRDRLARPTTSAGEEAPQPKPSELLALRIDDFMRERISDVQAWSAAPAVIAAARLAHNVHEQAGFLALKIADIEARFEIRKSLGRFPIADGYLRAESARAAHFDRILLTDRNGYNVVVTNVSSDFVQSDEEWWQRAWRNGVALSGVEYDASSNAWKIDIAVRIDDPGTELAVGVMHAPINITHIQGIVDRYRTERNRITLVDDQGFLIAETSSKHSSARIMNEQVNLRDAEEDPRSEVFGATHSGQAIDDDWVTEFSHTAAGDYYAGLTGDAQFQGFQWGTIVQNPADAQAQGVVEGALDMVERWQATYAVIIVISTVCIALFAVVLGIWSARQVSRPIKTLRSATLALGKGHTAQPIVLDTDDELADIAHGVEGLRRTVRGALRVLKVRRALHAE